MNLLRKVQSLSVGGPLQQGEQKEQGDVWLQQHIYLLTAVWFGLLAGALEGIGQYVKVFYLDRLLWWMSPHVIWTAPLASITVFSILGLLFQLGARWQPRLFSPQLAAFLFSLFAYRTVLSLTSRIHNFGALLLAAGLALQTSRLLVRHPHAYNRILYLSFGWTRSLFGRARRSDTKKKAHPDEQLLLHRREFLGGAGAYVAAVALGVQGKSLVTEFLALARLSPAVPNASNVILIVLDTVRAKNMSLHGYKRDTTPWMTEFSQTGVLFDRAFANAPWTTPSHASFLTGRWPHEFGTWWRGPRSFGSHQFPTLAEVLTKNGYATAGFSANLGAITYLQGFDRGFTHFEDFRISPGQIYRNSYPASTVVNLKLLRAAGYYDKPGRKRAPMVSRAFLRWLSQRDRERPFFAFLNYFDAHEPYLPPTEYALRFAAEKPRGHFPSVRDLSDQLIQELNDAYDGSIAYLDENLRLLFAELNQGGILENTLVIITSDHGEHFGEHGLIDHGNSLYLPLLHVPLLISHPAYIPADRVFTSPVSLRDIPSTVMDVLNLEPREIFPGRTLTKHWSDYSDLGEPDPQPILSEVQRNPWIIGDAPAKKGSMKSLIFNDMHYIYNKGDGQEELYDIQLDPLEVDNLAGVERNQVLMELFRHSLADMMTGS